MKKFLNERGFHLIMIPLIVVVVGIIGFAGWYVYNANRDSGKALDSGTNTNSNSQTSATTPTPTASPMPIVTVTPNPDATASWKDATGKYADQNYGFNYKIPSDWDVSNTFPDIKSLLAETRFTKNYMLDVYSTGQYDIHYFYDAFYVNSESLPDPSGLTTLQVNGLTAYKFYIPNHGDSDAQGTGTAHVLFYEAATSQHVSGVAVDFMFFGGSAEEALADETLDLIAGTFSFE